MVITEETFWIIDLNKVCLGSVSYGSFPCAPAPVLPPPLRERQYGIVQQIDSGHRSLQGIEFSTAHTTSWRSEISASGSAITPLGVREVGVLAARIGRRPALSFAVRDQVSC